MKCVTFTRTWTITHSHTRAHISPVEFIHPALAGRRIFRFFLPFLNVVFYVFVCFWRTFIYIVPSRLTHIHKRYVRHTTTHTLTHCIIVVIVILRCDVRSSIDTPLPPAPPNVGQTKFDNIYAITSTWREFSFWFFFLTIRSV